MKPLISSLLFLSQLTLLASGVENDWIQFNAELPAQPIGRHIQLLSDPGCQLGIRDVLTSTAFQHSTTVVPNLGVSNAAHWAKFSIVNSRPSEKPVIILDFPEIEHLDVYLQNQNRLERIFTGGQSLPVNRLLQESPTYAYELDIPYGGVGTVYIRVAGQKQMQLPIYLVDQAEKDSTLLDRAYYIGGYSGIMLVMIFYNLFIFISVRDRSYLLYVISIISVFIAQLSFTGYLGYYLFSDWTWAKEHASLFFTVTSAITANVFMDSFIHASVHVRKFRMVVNTFYTLFIAAALLDLLGARIAAYGIVQLLSLVLALYTLAVSIVVTRKGQRPGRFYLIAWCIFLAGIVVFVAKDWGLLPYNDLTKYMMTIGSCFEVVLLSFGLADKINILRKDKERSQAEALWAARENEQIILNQNVVLEHKVTERTQALQASNDHLKKTQTKLVSAEKMASLGQLTAGIAHEINNPLNFISSNVEPLKRDLLDLKQVLDAYREATLTNPDLEHVRELERRIDLAVTVNEVHEILYCIEQGSMRTSEIVRGLRTFSRLDEDDLKQADLNEGLRSTVVVLGPQFRDSIKIHFDFGDLPPVECYPGKLNQAFMNLLNNAAHAVKQRHGNQGGEIRITTWQEGDLVKISIADNGIGMDEHVKQRLFEPFFTTKDVGEGTGLGLSITQGIIEKHNGELGLQSAVGLGSTFTITLPKTQLAQLAKSA